MPAYSKMCQDKICKLLPKLENCWTFTGVPFFHASPFFIAAPLYSAELCECESAEFGQIDVNLGRSLSHMPGLVFFRIKQMFDQSSCRRKNAGFFVCSEM